MSVEKALTVEEVYYNLYPEEADPMESIWHNDLIRYLVEVLSWYYRLAQVRITSDLPFILGNVQAAADVAIVKGVKVIPYQGGIRDVESWVINPPDRPAPAVVFEISSKGTWPIDIGEQVKHKPQRYQQIGVQEYYAFDPHDLWNNPVNNSVNLRIWERENGQLVERELDAQGRFWSTEMNCFVVPEARWLRFYTEEGNRLLTEAEDQSYRAAHAEADRELQAQRAAQAEKERQREAERAAHAEKERQREAERAVKAEREREQLAQRAQAELERAVQAELEKAKAEKEAERVKAEFEALKAKLLANNVDLDNLK
jgi:Uma2 family endonuclease